MHYPHDDLYHDRTWFDALGELLAQQARRMLPRNRACLWTGGFALFAALCVAWAAGLATQAALFEVSWNQRVAETLAAGMLLMAARHFLAVTGVSAGHALPQRKLIVRPVQRPAPAAPPAAAVAAATSCGGRRTHDDAAAAQAFFRAVREAGINVRIAQSLYAAGFRSAAQVRACSDAQLLATPGVGQATLRKLRIQFGLPQTAERAQSDAA